MFKRGQAGGLVEEVLGIKRWKRGSIFFLLWGDGEDD